ncbi:MAG: class I SAM-dependent methyltransferase [Symploca sp. SIO1B1]|nr:class I SAM-dependent methyltransferase [Symploca sp. SIO1B1]
MIDNRNSRNDWQQFAPENIPSKSSMSQLEQFLDSVSRQLPKKQPLRLLDLGCGNGAISKQLYEKGFSVIGIDINTNAIEAAQESFAVADEGNPHELKFFAGDIASEKGLLTDAQLFDVVIGQLVISIIGNVDDRNNLLRNIFKSLEPDGWLYLSASGISDTINNQYQQLYDADYELTKERYTYFSRNKKGEVLYTTHHFSETELQSLISQAGFNRIEIKCNREVSSRRPDEAAYFYYVTCRKPTSPLSNKQ